MKALVVSLFVLTVASNAFADDGLGLRDENRKIEQGVRTGELTRREARKLRGEESSLREERREDLADGHLSRSEKKELRKDEERLDHDIYREKHDGEVR